MYRPDVVIVTVCRSGGDFRAEHAEALHHAIDDNNLHRSLLHVCFTDCPVTPGYPIITLSLERGYRGRWAQMECFDAPRRLHEIGITLPLDQQYLYLDLDTVVVAPIDALLDELARHPRTVIACLPDIYRPHRFELGIMGWRAPLPARMVAERFAADAPVVCPRDPDAQCGEWFRRRCDDIARLFDRWAAGVLSYKHDLRDRDKWLSRQPADGHADPSLVVFHGQPRPWAVGGEAHVRDMIARKLPHRARRTATDGP